jgi:hypothetical protein
MGAALHAAKEIISPRAWFYLHRRSLLDGVQTNTWIRKLLQLLSRCVLAANLRGARTNAFRPCPGPIHLSFMPAHHRALNRPIRPSSLCIIAFCVLSAADVLRLINRSGSSQLGFVSLPRRRSLVAVRQQTNSDEHPSRTFCFLRPPSSFHHPATLTLRLACCPEPQFTRHDRIRPPSPIEELVVRASLSQAPR